MSTVIIIGRSRNSDIVINDPHVSGSHAQLIIDDDGSCFINDLSSSNGTFVNGERINGVSQLRAGDFVVLGGSHFDWEKHITSSDTPSSHTKQEQFSKPLTYAVSLAAAILLLLACWGLNELSAAPSSVPSDEIAENSRARKTGGTNSDENTKDDNQGDGSVSNKQSKAPGEITYDFSCIVTQENQDAAGAGDILDDMRTDMLNSSGLTVSIQEEMDFGDQNHEELLNGATILNNEQSDKLESILNTLVRNIPEPKGFTYRIFLIESDQINAWTCGGRIYFTTAMYDFTESDNEIAGIVGHEIYHNELGHINKMLLAQKFSEQTFGPEMGGIAATIDGILRSPFGKKDEAHCDFKGADLCIRSGYQPCPIVDLWERMARDEGEQDSLSEFMSSHPLSSQRRLCLKNHIATNYGEDCE